MKTVSIEEAERDFPAVLRLVRAGEEVNLTHRKAPVARIIPLKRRSRKYDWAGTWSKVDAIHGGKPAPGKPGSRIVIEGRR
jgi:antitoxin (DNA-binding transcriptional repressor) of toxin-antitoxin stability system